jgi:hypothetical protein
MNLDVDNLINFFGKSFSNKSEELDEQDAAAAAPGGGTGRAVKKWASNRTMGKTYMGDPKYKWETGLARGKANPVGNTVWASGRKMGPTGGSDFA